MSDSPKNPATVHTLRPMTPAERERRIKAQRWDDLVATYRSLELHLDRDREVRRRNDLAAGLLHQAVESAEVRRG